MGRIDKFEDIEAWKHARIRDHGVGIRLNSEVISRRGPENDRKRYRDNCD
jgi:hypothetical protein